MAAAGKSHMTNELEMIANLQNQTFFFFFNQWHCIVSDNKNYLPFFLVFCIWLGLEKPNLHCTSDNQK